MTHICVDNLGLGLQVLYILGRFTMILASLVQIMARILLSTLTSVASDLFNYALRLDNELSARPPRGRHGL